VLISSHLSFAPQGVGGEEGVGDHIRDHLERFVVDGLSGGCGTAGNLAEQVAGEAGTTGLDQGESRQRISQEASATAFLCRTL
jgi:hypothetical protein